jgi:hypothetical protein
MLMTDDALIRGIIFSVILIDRSGKRDRMRLHSQFERGFAYSSLRETGFNQPSGSRLNRYVCILLWGYIKKTANSRNILKG